MIKPRRSVMSQRQHMTDEAGHRVPNEYPVSHGNKIMNIVTEWAL